MACAGRQHWRLAAIGTRVAGALRLQTAREGKLRARLACALGRLPVALGSLVALPTPRHSVNHTDHHYTNRALAAQHRASPADTGPAPSRQPDTPRTGTHAMGHRQITLALALLLAAALPPCAGAARGALSGATAATAAAAAACVPQSQLATRQAALMQKATVLFAYEWGPSDIGNFGSDAEARATKQLDRIALQVPQLAAEQQSEWRPAIGVAKVGAHVACRLWLFIGEPRTLWSVGNRSRCPPPLGCDAAHPF